MRRRHALSLAMTALLLAGASTRMESSPSDTAPGSPVPTRTPREDVTATAPVADFDITLLTVSNGAATKVVGSEYGLGITVGQVVAGRSIGSDYQLGFGFWYGAGGIGGCAILNPGDVNVSGTVNTADIIYIVNYIFRAGPLPLPCEANGDVNCSGDLIASDIIVLVNYVLKAGAPPCNTCASPMAAGC